MPGSEKEESLDSSDDEDKRSADLNSRKSPPLFRVPAAGSSGSPAGNTRGIARRAVTSGKEQKKRKK